MPTPHDANPRDHHLLNDGRGEVEIAQTTAPEQRANRRGTVGRTTRLATLLIVVTASALAQSQTVPQTAPQAARTAVPTSTTDGATYVNGGVGTEEADKLRALSPQFPVRMTFSRHNPEQNTDEFVADVKLRVTDRTGRTVVDLSAQGPIFLLKLPDGPYKVEAQRQGDVKTRNIDVVTGRHQEIAFSWAG